MLRLLHTHTARLSKHSAIDLIHIRLYLIHIRLDLIHTRLDRIHIRLDLIHTQIDLIHTRLDLIHTQLDLKKFGCCELTASSENLGQQFLIKRLGLLSPPQPRVLFTSHKEKLETICQNSSEEPSTKTE